MFAFSSTFFANLWISFGPDLVTVLFWALVGVVVISPVMTIDAAYQAHKIGSGYSFRQGYHLKRMQHEREAWRYGTLFLLVTYLFWILLG